jgi:ABC-2 type transport system ATP-binding protein
VLAEVERMTERVVAMVDGRLAAVGSVADIRSAMTDRPRLVFIETTNNRRLGSELMSTEGVIGVHIEPGRLRVEASDAGDLAKRLPSVAVAAGVGITRVEPADESLESVFRYLVEGGE